LLPKQFAGANIWCPRLTAAMILLGFRMRVIAEYGASDQSRVNASASKRVPVIVSRVINSAARHDMPAAPQLGIIALHLEST
jgi:hypothetical protein